MTEWPRVCVSPRRHASWHLGCSWWCWRRDCACRPRTWLRELGRPTRQRLAWAMPFVRPLGLDSGNDQKASEPRHRAAQSLRLRSNRGERCLVRRSPIRARKTRGNLRRNHPRNHPRNRRKSPRSRNGRGPTRASRRVAGRRQRRRWWRRHSPTAALSSHRSTRTCNCPTNSSRVSPTGPAVLDAGGGAVAAAVRRRPSGAHRAAGDRRAADRPRRGCRGCRTSGDAAGTTAWRAPRRDGRAAGRTCPAARQRGQQAPGTRARPTGSGTPNFCEPPDCRRSRPWQCRACGHSCTHRCRGISRVPPGEGGPRGASGWHRPLHEVAQTAPSTGVGGA